MASRKKKAWWAKQHQLGGIVTLCPLAGFKWRVLRIEYPTHCVVFRKADVAAAVARAGCVVVREIERVGQIGNVVLRKVKFVTHAGKRSTRKAVGK